MTIPKVLFCPLCHIKIIVPKWLLGGNVKGNVNIACPNKKCKGKVKLKLGEPLKQPEEIQA